MIATNQGRNNGHDDSDQISIRHASASSAGRRPYRSGFWSRRRTAGGGYVNWHRDHRNDEAWRFLGRPLNTKVFVYLTDVGPDDGCTACVAGSHLWDHEPDHLVYKGMGGGDSQAEKVRDQRDMPGMVAAEVKAGSAFLFKHDLVIA